MKPIHTMKFDGLPRAPDTGLGAESLGTEAEVCCALLLMLWTVRCSGQSRGKGPGGVASLWKSNRFIRKGEICGPERDEGHLQTSEEWSAREARRVGFREDKGLS